MSFAALTRQALQPTALMLEPDVGRRQFVADLERFGRVQRAAREQPEAQARQAHDFDVRSRHSGQYGYGYLQPGADSDTRWNPRYRAPGHPQQYLLDAIGHDLALAEYDRTAPRLREEDRAGLRR